MVEAWNTFPTSSKFSCFQIRSLGFITSIIISQWCGCHQRCHIRRLRVMSPVSCASNPFCHGPGESSISSPVFISLTIVPEFHQSVATSIHQQAETCQNSSTFPFASSSSCDCHLTLTIVEPRSVSI